MLTQKYKQQQQQVRVQTNESNYAKGMFFSDVPLTEGYSKVLVNWDIDPTTGKLTPRKGLKTTKHWGNMENLGTYGTSGLINIDARVIATPYGDTTVAQKQGVFSKRALVVGHFTENNRAFLMDCPLERSENTHVCYFGGNFLSDACIPKRRTKNVDERIVGTFAYNYNYYTFLNKLTKTYSGYHLKYLGRLPYIKYPGANFRNFNTIRPFGSPGEFVTCGNPFTIPQETGNNNPQSRDNIVWYYNGEGKPVYCYFEFLTGGAGVGERLVHLYRKIPEPGEIIIPEGSDLSNDYRPGQPQELLLQQYNSYTAYRSAFGSNTMIEIFKELAPYIDDINGEGRIMNEYKNILCCTKLGKDIKNTDINKVDGVSDITKLTDAQYYLCEVEPQVLNPSEASSWGYNMLLDDPYDFVCEKTATNTITILGMLPYDSAGKVTLMPRKNQELTLKAYCRMPEEYHTDAKKGMYYATAQQKIEEPSNSSGTVTTASRNPKTLQDLKDYTNEDYSDYAFGSWWYCSEEKKYYMVVPGALRIDSTDYEHILDEPTTTKPPASVLLKPIISGDENEVRVRWQIRTVDSSDWIDIYNEKIKLSEHGLEPFTVTTTMSSDELLIKFTISDPSQPTVELNGEEFVLTTNTIGLSLISDDLASTLNLHPVKYDLGTCSGMLEWEKRLVLWGVANAENILFVSDVNNPAYFPYPNNIDTFDEPIRAVYNFGKELLVLTASALYRLAWDAEGAGWTHKLVQRNLRVTDTEAERCCVVKNMFMFMSNNHYYLMIPKATSEALGETTIAPISKPINDLLDNWDTEIKQLCLTIADKSSFDMWVKMPDALGTVSVSNNKILINEVYQIGTTTLAATDNREESTHPVYLYIQLIYDTDTRAWSIRMFNTSTIQVPVVDNTVADELYLTTVNQDDHETFEIALTEMDKEDLSDRFVIHNVKVGFDSDQYRDSTELHYLENPVIDNYQYLDTGNRDINTDMKKRFREFQFKIRNVNATSLGLHTSFLIDGSLRRDLQKFSPRYITDEATGEAVIVIERTLDNNPNYLSFVPEYKITRVDRVIVPENMLQDSGELTPTTLAESTDPDYWVIDQSAFPGRTFWKIRVAISGKGYTPRAQLLSTNLKHFEVLGHNWVYRTMHGR